MFSQGTFWSLLLKNQNLVIIHFICTVESDISSVQIGDRGNVLVYHVHERKRQKHSPWACLFSGGKFCGSFHLSKINIAPDLELVYCFHCDIDQLWTHTQQLIVKTTPQHPTMCTFWHEVICTVICRCV